MLFFGEEEYELGGGSKKYYVIIDNTGNIFPLLSKISKDEKITLDTSDNGHIFKTRIKQLFIIDKPPVFFDRVFLVEKNPESISILALTEEGGEKKDVVTKKISEQENTDEQKIFFETEKELLHSSVSKARAFYVKKNQGLPEKEWFDRNSDKMFLKKYNRAIA